jgi:hypothetical protein
MPCGERPTGEHDVGAGVERAVHRVVTAGVICS